MFVRHSEKDMRRNHKGDIQSPHVCSVVEIAERSLHTCVFSCPIKPSSKLYLHVWLTGKGEKVREEEERKWEERRSFWLWSGITWLWQHSSLSTAEACHSCWCPAVFNHTWIQAHADTFSNAHIHAYSITHSFLACMHTNHAHTDALSLLCSVTVTTVLQAVHKQNQCQDAPTQDAKITSLKSCS